MKVKTDNMICQKITGKKGTIGEIKDILEASFYCMPPGGVITVTRDNTGTYEFVMGIMIERERETVVFSEE